MKSEKLNKYLELKGFTENDLYDNNAIILDNDGFIGPTDKTKWVNTVVVSDGDKEYTVIDILKKKERQYFNEGVTSAIFVPLFNLCDEFVGMSIRKMGESKHDSWFMPGERKIDLIYNLNNAIIPASNKSSIIITEGVYDTITLKRFARSTYTNGILLMLVTMIVFTNEFITLSAIIFTLLAMAIYILIYKLKNKINKNKKTDRQISNEISIGFYLGVANILVFILALIYDYYVI